MNDDSVLGMRYPNQGYPKEQSMSNNVILILTGYKQAEKIPIASLSQLLTI